MKIKLHPSIPASLVMGLVIANSAFAGTGFTFPKHVGDYLWETTTENENWDAATNYFYLTVGNDFHGMCTGVHAGHLHGRNFDWKVNYEPTIVVISPAGRGKYASIGVSCGISVTNALLEANVKSGTWDDRYYVIPFSMMDGINEKGVTIQINVIPGDPGRSVKWRTKADNVIPQIMVIRKALDLCDTARKAADYINDNVYVPDRSYYDFHYLVSDRDSCFIVEDGKVLTSATHATDLMTNFRVTDTARGACNSDGTLKWGCVESYGQGLERYDWVRTNGLDMTTSQGMLATMTNLWYTNAYGEPNKAKCPTWFTEFCEPTMPELTVMNAVTNQSAFTKTVNAERKVHLEEMDARSPHYRNGQTWHTSHTTVYDQEKLTMRIIIQQDPTSEHEYKVPQSK